MVFGDYKNDELFFKLWRNIAINATIFKFSRLYIKYGVAEFDNIKKLRKYKLREFISKLTIKDPPKRKNDPRTVDIIILPGDIPNYGILKELDLRCCHSFDGIPIDRFQEFIPSSVEIIIFNYGQPEFQLSELPNTIHTCLNVPFKKPYADNPIPNHIREITLNNKLDKIEFYNVVLPLSITKLDLSFISNEHQIFKTYIIPSSVTDLSILYENGHESYLPVIPSTIRKLTIFPEIYAELIKGVVPFGVRELEIYQYDEGFELLANSLPESITKLHILCDKDAIHPNSIPSSVKNLTIRNLR